MSDEATRQRDQLVELRECYEILQGTTRRCVRDMRHMIDDLKPLPTIDREEWLGRLGQYELILGGTADYRLRIHRDMTMLEWKIQRLEQQLQEEINKNAALQPPVSPGQGELFETGPAPEEPIF